MTEKFKELYEYCQNLEPKISRNLIRDKVQELYGTPIITCKTDLNTQIVRGYFVSANNPESIFYKKVGGKDVVVLARGLNKCWERFVYVKELMHVFDKKNELVGTAVDLSNLLNSFEIPPTINGNEPFKSEIAAFWMA